MDTSPDVQETLPTPAVSLPVSSESKTNWAITTLIALVTLLIGIALGYGARPILDPALAPPAVVIVVTPAPLSAVNMTVSAASTKQATFLDAVIAQTRHFKGNTNASVTIIEFGDFQ